MAAVRVAEGAAGDADEGDDGAGEREGEAERRMDPHGQKLVGPVGDRVGTGAGHDTGGSERSRRNTLVRTGKTAAQEESRAGNRTAEVECAKGTSAMDERAATGHNGCSLGALNSTL